MKYSYFWINHIDGVMVSVLASNAVDCGFEPQSRQIKDRDRYLLLLYQGGRIKEKEERLDGLESE